MFFGKRREGPKAEPSPGNEIRSLVKIINDMSPEELKRLDSETANAADSALKGSLLEMLKNLSSEERHNLSPEFVERVIKLFPDDTNVHNLLKKS